MIFTDTEIPKIFISVSQYNDVVLENNRDDPVTLVLRTWEKNSKQIWTNIRLKFLGTFYVSRKNCAEGIRDQVWPVNSNTLVALSGEGTDTVFAVRKNLRDEYFHVKVDGIALPDFPEPVDFEYSSHDASPTRDSAEEQKQTP